MDCLVAFIKYILHVFVFNVCGCVAFSTCARTKSVCGFHVGGWIVWGLICFFLGCV